MEFKSLFDESPSNDTVIPLPNVASKPLADVIEYCKKELEFRAASAPEEERKKFDEEFLNAKSNDEIKVMKLAATYLQIQYLLDMLGRAVVDRIKNKSDEYVRRFFGINVEGANLRAENEWASS